MNDKAVKQASAWTCLGQEILQGLLSLLIFAGGYAAFYVLLPNTGWVMQVWPAMIMTFLLRSALLQKPRSFPPAAETWRGWIAADLFVLGSFLYYHQTFPETGYVLFITPVFGAAFRSSPYLIARLSAFMLVFFIVARGLVDPPVDVLLWVKQMAVLLLFLLISMLISVQQYRHQRSIARFGSEALALFERVHLNLLLIDPRQIVLEANRCALDVLHLDAKDVRGQSIHSLVLDAPGQSSSTGIEAAHWCGVITQPGGSLKKVMVEQVPLSLPLSLDKIGQGRNIEECSLVLITDVNQYVEEHEAGRIAKQNTVLKRMLEVFADGVRNPLAGVSAHIQILARSGLAASEEDWEQQQKRFSTIVKEISEVDTLMETLMNQARLTPEDVEKRFQALKEQRQSSSL